MSAHQDTLRWGIWGACSRQSSASPWKCTSAGLEYPSDLWNAFQNSIFSNMGIADGFIIQPIATGLAGASILLALSFLLRLRRNPHSIAALDGWALCILAFAAVGAAAAALALELYFFIQARNQVRANHYDKSAAANIVGSGANFDTISSADLGPANWMQAAGLGCASVGCIIAVVAARKASRLSSEANDRAASQLEAGILGESVVRDGDTDEMYFMHQTPSTAGLIQSDAREAQAGLIANKSPDLRDPLHEGQFGSDPYYADTTTDVLPNGSQTSASKWHSPGEEYLSPSGFTKGSDDLAYGGKSYGYGPDEGVDTSAEYIEALSPSYEAQHESAFAFSPHEGSFASEQPRKPSRSFTEAAYADPSQRSAMPADPRISIQGELPPTLLAAGPPSASRLSPAGGASVASRLSSRMSRLMSGYSEADDADETETSNGSTGRRGVLRRSGSVRVHQAARMSLQSRLGSELSGPSRSKRGTNYDASVADDAESELPPDESVMGQYDIYGAPSEAGGYSVADYLKPSPSPRLAPPQASSPPASILKPPQHFPVRGYLGATPPSRLPPSYDELEEEREDWHHPDDFVEEAETASHAETENSVDSWAIGPRELPRLRERGRVPHPLRTEVQATPSVRDSMASDELEFQAADDETVVQGPSSRSWNNPRPSSKRPRPGRRGF